MPGRYVGYEDEDYPRYPDLEHDDRADLFMDYLVRDYRREVRELEDGQWYWNIYLLGERVNGGLSATHEDALADARFAMFRHAHLSRSAPVPPWRGL